MQPSPALLNIQIRYATSSVQTRYGKHWKSSNMAYILHFISTITVLYVVIIVSCPMSCYIWRCYCSICLYEIDATVVKTFVYLGLTKFDFKIGFSPEMIIWNKRSDLYLWSKNRFVCVATLMFYCEGKIYWRHCRFLLEATHTHPLRAWQEATVCHPNCNHRLLRASIFKGDGEMLTTEKTWQYWMAFLLFSYYWKHITHDCCYHILASNLFYFSLCLWYVFFLDLC